jgi:colanic acid biosynthesis glycosyl transferase WcaI
VRILFLSDNFPPEVNASASRVYERACYWVAEGEDVTVVTCFPNFPQGRIYPGYRQKLLQREALEGVKVLRVPTYVARNEGFARRTLDFLSFMVSAVFGAPFAGRADVVVATTPQFFAAVAGWIIAVVRRRPFVLELSDLWPASIKAVGAMRPGFVLRMVERLELFLYRRAAAIVALTHSFKENLVARGIPERKIAVVINGADLRRYGPRSRCEALAREHGLQDKFVVGYLGTHGMAHALGNVLEAAALLRDREDIRFLFVGDGAAKPALERRALQLGLQNVVFVLPQPKARVANYWSLCNLALIHLKDDAVFAEVIPSKMFEAMAMGIPILAAVPEGEASRIVRREGVGLCVPPEDPLALADAVTMLRSDAAQTRALADASLKAAPLHSRHRQAQEMLRVLAAVVTGHGDRAVQVVNDG